MNFHRKRNWISLLVLLGASLMMPLPVRAFMLTLGGGSIASPGALRNEGADALYATDRDGDDVKLAGTDVRLGDALPLDLGMPSVGPDGTVFFGAAFRRHDQVRWEIFQGDPDTHQISLVSLHGTENVLGEFLSDPAPLAQPDGSIVFAGEQQSGSRAVYRLSGRKLSCLLRTGERLSDRSTLKNIGFGTVAAMNDAVALIGYLTSQGKAILLIANGKTEIVAAVGQKAPDGTRYRDLGLPALNGAQNLILAFPALTEHGSSLFELRNGNLQRALVTNTACPSGRITYISLDRVGLDSEGTIAVATTCAGRPGIFLVRDGRVTMVAGAEQGSHGCKFTDVGNPSLLDTGRVIFDATKTGGTEEIYSVGPGMSLDEPATPVPLLSDADSPLPPLHSIVAASVAYNKYGRLAYLGSPIESIASGQTQ